MLKLNEDTINQLIIEIREGYNIPFFFSDEMLFQAIQEGNYYLSRLVGNIDYDEDLQARMLLKNYVLYSYHNRLDDFEDNYAKTIVAWQFDRIPKVDDDEGEDETEQE